MRRCRTCGLQKELSEFWRQRSKKNGLQAECKSCMRQRNNSWQRKNKVTRTAKKIAQINEARRKDPLRALWKNARERARNRGLEFTIRWEDLRVPSHCPILCIPLQSHLGLGRTGHHVDYSPSIDRIDNSRGYTPDNIVIVSYRANRLKSDASIEELRKIVEFYDEQRYLASHRGDGDTSSIDQDGVRKDDMSEMLASQAKETRSLSFGENR